MCSASRAACPALLTQTFGPQVPFVQRGAERVRDHLAAAHADRPGGAVGTPDRLDLGAGGVLALEPRGERRLVRAVPPVALGEQRAGGVEVLVGEGSRLRAAARSRTIA